ncbi:hypothetical protein ASG17_10595 [Brevundimonas sp. Leaf363]|uniref:pyrroloquinoline quinone-dependent dehydrogenase n=1 Tax=Brevundimonas sp. Leaf363 TaxID=1736353 RepID=UPI0006F3B932|nr:pyrroloquinoline quinone-dependent dehydrogenase [Brevundimonas sp. Leaf363]KQS56429.1 hypothetical protein ASG17_10595 [Brevundimonas sp. Leaf363]
MGRQDLQRLGVVAAGVLTTLIIPLAIQFSGPGQASRAVSAVADWPRYGGPTGDRYSPLEQITPANVARLQEVWRVETGDGGLQTNPLIVGRTLYAYTADQKVIALDASTGRRLWTFDSGVAGAQPARGMSLWRSGVETRLFAGVGDRMWALDLKTGRPIKEFGEDGAVDLRQGLGNDPELNATFLTTPGVVYRNLVIVGFRTSESRPAAPGALRAYNVRTGKIAWTFHFIPRPGQYGHDTWPADAWKTAGGANNWAGMALDAERGIVFAPTGSAVDDFYGADRPGDNLFANSLVAIDAASGRRLWHFQGVHHDIWDRDFPSPPQLLTVTHQGRRIDAVAQTSKQGFVYLFERETGRPLFPIEERVVAASTVPGEVAARTQPFPTAPEPFARQRLTAEGLSDRSPAINAWARRAFAALMNGPQFTPFSVDRQTVLFPGFDGGAEWGGAASDRRGVIYVNSNDIAWLGGLSSNSGEISWGESIYRSQCAVCHGSDRRGAPPEFPSLLGVGDRLSASRIGAILDHGGGRMPAFPAIKGDERRELIAWLTGATGQNREVASAGLRQASTYGFTGYRKFTDPDGYPAVAPPWGTLNAIDMNSGRYLWRVPLGEYPALAAQGVPTTGTENYGGPVVTAGGVLFIGATIHDRLFRAFDRRNGRLLWQAPLPYAGVATPATYMVDGRQYVVIAASGARDQAGPQGSAYVAFALPGR